MALRASAICALLLVLAAGCGGKSSSEGSSSTGESGVCAQFGDVAAPRETKAPWSAPGDPMALTCAAGLIPEKAEFLQYHVHAHLDVFVDGATVAVPAGLGINVGPDGQAPPHGAPGIAPLHTHDESGVLHIEAPKDAKFTLGQVFTEWGVALDSDHVGAYPVNEVVVDGKPYDGDPARVVLSAHEEIAVVAGTGTVDPPSSYAFPAGE